jgi:hypothetical protein
MSRKYMEEAFHWNSWICKGQEAYECLLVLAKIIHFSKYLLMILHDNILDIVHIKIPRDLARGIFCI